MEIKIEKIKDNKEIYDLLFVWCNKEYVNKYFEQRKLSYEEIENKYKKRTSNYCKIKTYIISCDENKIGLVQYQKIDNIRKKECDLKEENVYEIDIFIGDENYHNKGIGSKAIELIIKEINNQKVDLIIMCPKKDNYNGIKCYQKVGFKKEKKFISTDNLGNKNEYILMTK